LFCTSCRCGEFTNRSSLILNAASDEGRSMYGDHKTRHLLILWISGKVRIKEKKEIQQILII
jgi:hypothetical protein